MIPKRWMKVSLIAGAIVLVLLFSGVVYIRYTYNNALQPVSNSQKLTLVTVASGASVSDIATLLKNNGLIRETWGFEWYVRNNGLSAEMKAGTYAFTPSQGVGEIARILARGEVATDLVTILPGQRIDQIEASLINSGFKPSDVEDALRPSHYKDHPALVDKPPKASLEGYLYPESFQKTAETKTQDIIKASLDEMQKRLTPDIRAAMARRGLSVHEGIILASMVEQEVSNSTDRPIVAQVFLKRLKDGMRLESDVTAFYGAILADQPTSVSFESKHNTYLHDGLPPTPISNVSKVSLSAVAYPAKSDYLFFVAGDDGKTYFSRTQPEHEAAVKAHCKKLCQ